MKVMILAIAALATGTGALAHLPRADYPSCDIAQQRALKAPTGGAITDPREAHLSMRINILEADLSNARIARLVTAAQVTRLDRRLTMVRHRMTDFVKRQGFVSAGETASYDRELDMIAMRLCG